MMGPLHRFRGQQHLDKLLAEAQATGIKVKPDKKRAALEAFWFRRGLGLIHGSVWLGGSETLIYFGFGHPFNPLLWFADRSLLKSIQLVFVSNGSEAVDLNAIAEPATPPDSGPAHEPPPSVS
jgi:hypothetical protein